MNSWEPSERRVLEALPPEGRLRLPEIAEAAGVSSGTLLTTARKMSDRGLLDLRQEDGAWHLGLTAEGAQAMRGPEGEETDEAAAYEAAPRRRSACPGAARYPRRGARLRPAMAARTTKACRIHALRKPLS